VNTIKFHKITWKRDFYFKINDKRIFKRKILKYKINTFQKEIFKVQLEFGSGFTKIM